MITDIFSSVFELISSLIITFNYFGIILVTFIENIIAPIPSEFIFPWAGFLASQGKLDVWLISLAGALGSTIAALILYYLGTRFNGPKTREFVDKYGKYLFVSLNDLNRAEKWFAKYGVWTVFIFRFIPIGRSIVSIPAGFVKLNVFKFTSLTFLGTFIWCFVLTYAGFVLGSNWEEVAGFLKKYEKVIIIAVILMVGIFIANKLKNRGKNSQEPDIQETA